jgi:hypothetical protein
MGDLNELTRDLYCENRGLLPRLIEDLFNLATEQQTTSYHITCSYLEIYNEQIYDLVTNGLLSSAQTNVLTKFEKITAKESSLRGPSKPSLPHIVKQ